MRTSQEDAPSSVPSLPVARLVGHDGPIQAVRFTADGKYCLTAGQDRAVRLWNPARIDPAYPHPSGGVRSTKDIPVASLPRALPIQTYTDGHVHPVSCFAVDEESTTLVSASDKTVVITDVMTQQVKRRLQGHMGRINSVAIANECEAYLSASYDGTVRIWDGKSRSMEPIQILKEAKDSVSVVQVVQGSNEALIRTASVDGNVRTYDLRKGQVHCDDIGGAITGMAPTHDGECLAVSCLDGTIRLMEQSSGELLNTYVSHHKAGNFALECTLTADDAYVVTGSEDGRAVYYDLVRGSMVQSLQGHDRPTCSVATNPKRVNTAVAITASYDGNAVVWANDRSYVQQE